MQESLQRRNPHLVSGSCGCLQDGMHARQCTAAAPPSATYTVPDTLQDLAAAWCGSAPARRTQHAALHRTHLRSTRRAFCHRNILLPDTAAGTSLGCILSGALCSPGFEVGFPPGPHGGHIARSLHKLSYRTPGAPRLQNRSAAGAAAGVLLAQGLQLRCEGLQAERICHHFRGA